jgi:hypothetical protein
MPKFLETKLKREYGENSAIPYKVMNSLGAMKGNKETAKGREMESKHEKDTKMKKTAMPPFAHTHIEHHPDGSHTVTHMGQESPASKGGAFSKQESTSYAAPNHAALMSKLAEHLGAGKQMAEHVAKVEAAEPGESEAEEGEAE